MATDSMLSSTLLNPGREPCFCTLPPEATVKEATAELSRARLSVVAVMDKGQIQGVVTRTDLLALLGQTGGADSRDLTIDRVMTKQLVVAGPDKPMQEVLDTMERCGIEHLPVVKGERLQAVVHERDVLRSRIDGLQRDIDHLQEYIDGLHHAEQD
jgi:signal-transduction protein with cAMP-binding, CBS, and nucleotidyltransferase domain